MDLFIVFKFVVSKISIIFESIFAENLLTFDGVGISLGSIFIGITVIAIIIKLVFGAYSSNVNSKTISNSTKKGD